MTAPTRWLCLRSHDSGPDRGHRGPGCAGWGVPACPASGCPGDLPMAVRISWQPVGVGGALSSCSAPWPGVPGLTPGGGGGSEFGQVKFV